MQPLSQCPPARLAAVRGVLTDIDDTLTEGGQIAPEALQALHDLRAAGIPVIALTGRPAGWSEPLALAWPVQAIVAENGAVMLRCIDSQLQFDFTEDAATRAANFICLKACAADVIARVPGATLATDSPGRLTDIAIDHSEFAYLSADQIAAVCDVMHAHGLHATVSSIHINGWIGDHSKWTAAAWAVGPEQFNPADWIYVGDSTNDALMFARMPLSIGVANIARFVTQLSALPTYVTEAERGAGFAELSAALLRCKTMNS